MITHPTLKRNIPETAKQRLFRYFHALVYEYSISHYFFTFLLFVQTLQISYFAIHPVCCNLWELNAFQVIQKILGVISGSYIWRQGQKSLLLALNIVLLVILLIIGFIIVYQVQNARPESTKMATNLHELRMKIIQYVSCLFRTILLIPLISLQAYSIIYSLNDSSSTSVLLVAISITSFIILVSLTFLFVFLCIDNSPFSKFSLAGPISVVEKLKIIVKVVLGLFDGFLDINCNLNQDSFHMALTIIIALLLVYILYLIYVEPNMVHNIVRKSLQHQFVSLASLYVMIVVQKAASFNSSINICFILIIIIELNFAWVKAKQVRQDTLIFAQYKSLTTKNQILAYNYLLCQLIRDFYQQPLCLIKLQGILSDHVLHCKKIQEICGCLNIKKKIKTFLYEKDSVQCAKQAPLWFQFFKSNLQMNAQKMNHEPEFHLLLSYIEKDILRNNFVSYGHLQKCQSKQQSLSIQFLIYNQKRVLEKIFIEEDIKNNEKKQVDVNRFIQMTNLVQSFEEIVLKSSLQHLDFWKSLASHKKDKSIIMKEGNILLSTVKLCQQTYRKINENYPLNLKSIVLFSNYSKYILNNHELIQKNRSLFKMIKKKFNKSIKMSGEQQKQKYTQNSITGTIIISGERSNLGIMKHCNSKVTKILKYAPYELIGQNINMIMPKFLGKMHNQVLMKYLQQAEPQSNFVQRMAPMIDKNGFMILSRMMTKSIPSLINGLQLIGIFQKVKQKNVRHMNEPPKYLLYRCDTGNVEALSQNFYTYYGYRIMKVDQFSQISEQLNFNQVICDISMASMKNCEEGVQCELRLKRQSKKKVRIRAYLRMQLVYFGTTIRLLSIFSCGDGNFNSITIQNTMAASPATQVALSQRSETTQANGQQQTTKSIENPHNNQSKNQQILSQQELKQLQNKIPFKFKIFQVLLLVFFIINLSISAFQFHYNAEQTSLALSYLDHSQWISNSLIYLINVGYFSRMMHLSSKYPAYLPYFDLFRSNVSVSTDNLQKSEFWLTNKQNSYGSVIGFQFTEKPLVWQLGEQNTISSKKQTLSLHIFDLVTSSSLFNSAKSTDFNFNLILTSDPAAALSSSYIRNLFKIRYSSIYELIPAKQNYSRIIKQSYLQKISYYQKIGNIEIGIVSGAFVLFLLVMLKIIYNITKSIFSITSLFNWLTHLQIQKQIDRCQNFLQHFFVNSYEVGLRLNKSKILRGHSFQDSRCIDIDKAQQQQLMRTGNNMQQQQQIQKQNEFRDENIQSRDGECAESIDLVNMSEKVMKEPGKSSKMENRNQQMVPLKVEDPEYLIEQEVQSDQSLEIGDLTMFTPIILGLFILFIYFIGVYLLSNQCLHRTAIQISNQNLIQTTLQNLDKLKYYGLEAVVDSSDFKSYKNINNSFFQLSLQIYKLQQQLNAFSDVDQKIYPLQQLLYNENMNGICSSSFLQFQLYSAKSYSVEECSSINHGVLAEGLRASIVAYIQNIKNTTKFTSISDLISSDSMNRILVFDKYIKSSIRKIMAKNKQSSKGYFEQESKITIALFSLFILIILLVILYIYVSTNKDLKLKILGTYQIISLIPQRIFKKNSNLCGEYRKNVKDLMQ